MNLRLLVTRLKGVSLDEDYQELIVLLKSVLGSRVSRIFWLKFQKEHAIRWKLFSSETCSENK